MQQDIYGDIINALRAAKDGDVTLSRRAANALAALSVDLEAAKARIAELEAQIKPPTDETAVSRRCRTCSCTLLRTWGPDQCRSCYLREALYGRQD